MLIVEVNEDQHRTPVAHFDKPDRLTVSGVHRGHQRRLYDLRKVEAARAAGYTVVVVPWQHSWRRDEDRDRERLNTIMADGGIA